MNKLIIILVIISAVFGEYGVEISSVKENYVVNPNNYDSIFFLLGGVMPESYNESYSEVGVFIDGKKGNKEYNNRFDIAISDKFDKLSILSSSSEKYNKVLSRVSYGKVSHNSLAGVKYNIETAPIGFGFNVGYKMLKSLSFNAGPKLSFVKFEGKTVNLVMNPVMNSSFEAEVLGVNFSMNGEYTLIKEKVPFTTEFKWKKILDLSGMIEYNVGKVKFYGSYSKIVDQFNFDKCTRNESKVSLGMKIK